LYAFIRKARVSLDIYDPQAADDEMLALLQKKGRMRRADPDHRRAREEMGPERFAEVRPLRGLRLHVRRSCATGRRAFCREPEPP